MATMGRVSPSLKPVRSEVLRCSIRARIIGVEPRRWRNRQSCRFHAKRARSARSITRNDYGRFSPELPPLLRAKQTAEGRALRTGKVAFNWCIPASTGSSLAADYNLSAAPTDGARLASRERGGAARFPHPDRVLSTQGSPGPSFRRDHVLG